MTDQLDDAIAWVTGDDLDPEIRAEVTAALRDGWARDDLVVRAVADAARREMRSGWHRGYHPVDQDE
jgi:hypothetical protein